jgi:hypothetical protein
MKMTRLNIQIPAHLKAKFDPLRTQGTMASGHIRHLLERVLHHATEKGQKGR